MVMMGKLLQFAAYINRYDLVSYSTDMLQYYYSSTPVEDPVLTGSFKIS